MAMAINDLVLAFEAAKQRVEPIVKERRLVLPIFRIEQEKEGHFIGDGFFYSSPDKLSWKFGGTGFDEFATPENLLDSYRHYKGEDIRMEDALTDATRKLNEWYENLQKEYFS
jgi:hypothetical protein